MKHLIVILLFLPQLLLGQIIPLNLTHRIVVMGSGMQEDDEPLSDMRDTNMIIDLHATAQTPIANGDGYYYTDNFKLRYSNGKYYINTWYDRSVDSNNFFQPIADYQPLYDPDNGTVYFDGINDYIRNQVSFPLFNWDITWFIHAQISAYKAVSLEQDILAKSASFKILECDDAGNFAEAITNITDNGTHVRNAAYISITTASADNLLKTFYGFNKFDSALMTAIYGNVNKVYSTTGFTGTYIHEDSALTIGKLPHVSAHRYLQGEIRNIKLFKTRVSNSSMDSINQLIADTSFIIKSYKAVPNVQDGINCANVGLGYNATNDYLYCAKYGGSSFAKIMKKTIYNIDVDSIDLSDTIDYIQNVTYDGDSLLYLTYTELGKANAIENIRFGAYSFNTNGMSTTFDPPDRYGNLSKCCFSFVDDTLWCRGNNYIYALQPYTFAQLDSFSFVSSTNEGFWVMPNGSFYCGNDGNIKYYNSSHVLVKTYDISAITNEMEGLIIDKRGYLWFNADEYLHGGVINGNRLRCLNLSEYDE